MDNDDYHLMNNYENELLDLVMKKKGYPQTITNSDEKRMIKLMRRLGVNTNILEEEE